MSHRRADAVDKAMVSLLVRALLLAAIAVAAVAVSFWRTQLGLRYLPGLFTVVFGPLSMMLFVGLDLYAGFSVADWFAVSALIIAHLVLSVPVLPRPLYYVGSHLVRPDHLVHLLAGALVTRLTWKVLRRR